MLIEGLMPAYDWRTQHEIEIPAPSSYVYAAARRMTIRSLLRVRLLLWIREAPSRLFGLPLEQFPVVAEKPGEEVVMAICGRFWAWRGNILAVPVAEIPAFARPGYAKSYWSFSLEPRGPNHTLLRTETRIACYGETARKKFRAYWFFVGPFSAWIRLQILEAIRREAVAARRSA